MSCWTWFLDRVWRLWKFLAHLLTGKTEIERICLRYQHSPTHNATSRIEKSIRQSRQLAGLATFLLSPEASTDKALTRIYAVKKFSRKHTAVVSAVLARSLEQMCTLSKLCVELDRARTPYVAENKDHEAMLMELWTLLRPDVRISGPVSKDWSEIGFQGSSPATDFRGMGVLGLQQLIEFSRLYPARARAILSDSASHRNWFSYAITGLNLTADLVQLTRARKFNGWFHQFGATRQTAAHLYAIMFVRFNKAWTVANPRDVMSFQEIHTAFLAQLEADAAKGLLQPLPRQ